MPKVEPARAQDLGRPLYDRSCRKRGSRGGARPPRPWPRSFADSAVTAPGTIGSIKAAEGHERKMRPSRWIERRRGEEPWPTAKRMDTTEEGGTTPLRKPGRKNRRRATPLRRSSVQRTAASAAAARAAGAREPSRPVPGAIHSETRTGDPAASGPTDDGRGPRPGRGGAMCAWLHSPTARPLGGAKDVSIARARTDAHAR